MPSFGYFSLSVIEESSNTEFESLRFSQNVSENERKSSEERLGDMIKIYVIHQNLGWYQRLLVIVHMEWAVII